LPQDQKRGAKPLGRLLKNSLLGEPGMVRGAAQSLQVIDPTEASPDMRRTRDLRNAQDVRFSTSCQGLVPKPRAGTGPSSMDGSA
jgi:hypothetical protein